MQLLDAVNKRVATPHAVGLPMLVVFIGVTSSVWLVHVTSIFNSGSSLPRRICVSTGEYNQRFPVLLFTAACFSCLLSPLSMVHCPCMSIYGM